jgi:hypothetical protein
MFENSFVILRAKNGCFLTILLLLGQKTDVFQLFCYFTRQKWMFSNAFVNFRANKMDVFKLFCYFGAKMRPKLKRKKN